MEGRCDGSFIAGDPAFEKGTSILLSASMTASAAFAD